jgi:hypothetical protein
MSGHRRISDVPLARREGRFMTRSCRSRAKEFAPIRSTGAPRMTARKYDPVVRKHVEFKEGKIK